MDGPLVYLLRTNRIRQGSQARTGYTLKASKREAPLKMRYPIPFGEVRPLREYEVDRRQV